MKKQTDKNSALSHNVCSVLSRLAVPLSVNTPKSLLRSFSFVSDCSSGSLSLYSSDGRCWYCLKISDSVSCNSVAFLSLSAAVEDLRSLFDSLGLRLLDRIDLRSFRRFNKKGV